MPQVFNVSNVSFLAGIILCLLTSIVLWKYAGAGNKQNQLLSFYFFTCSMGNLFTFLVYTGLMQYPPWFRLFRAGNIWGMIIMPVSFLYFRTVLKQKALKAIHLVHALPSFIYTIDYLPVFLLPAPEKRAMAEAEMAMPDRGQSIMHGWITPTINWIILRTVLMVIYWILQVRMLYATTRITGAQQLLRENASLFRWLVLLCVTQSLYFMPFFINAFLGADTYNFIAIHSFISLGAFVQIAFLLFRPEILYGFRGVIISHPVSSSVDAYNNPSGENNSPEQINLPVGEVRQPAGDVEQNITGSSEYLSKEKMEVIARVIEDVLTGQQAYLQKGYSMRDLSVATGYQPYLLSPVINQVYKQHFNDLINSRRIGHACSLIQSGTANLLTLQALADECGFNNRNTFTTAFKKHTGQIPSEYARQYSNASL